jgi:osmoprotectant transport system ATP-binding protein
MIRVEMIQKHYGERTVLASTSLVFAQGQTTALIGPSGCGKSTLLRLIAGLIAPDSGRIFLGSEELTPENGEVQRRQIGYVIQDGGLFPHLSAYDNVALLAKFLKQPINRIDTRVRELSALVQLPDAALERFPRELSGGQRQRVGLMRALMLDPKIILLDEPLGALDPITRSELQTQLKAIFAALGKTVVLVTHDMGEAAYFAETILLMRDGQVIQQGTLADLLERPAEPYVREFIQAQRSPLPQL